MPEPIKANRPYPIKVKLRDGRSASIRLMEAGDIDKILDFAAKLPVDDLLFLRTDITDRNVVKAWIDNIRNGNTITLLAEVEDELAAYASVHLDQARWTRKVGEIRINASSRFRSMGLGRRLAAEVFDLARSLDVDISVRANLRFFGGLFGLFGRRETSITGSGSPRPGR